MSSLYSWHDEHMVRLEREDLYKEIEQIRLLNDANQTNRGWFTQQRAKFRNWLTTLGVSVHRRTSTPIPQYYQSTSFKYSP